MGDLYDSSAEHTRLAKLLQLVLLALLDLTFWAKVTEFAFRAQTATICFVQEVVAGSTLPAIVYFDRHLGLARVHGETRW